MELKLEQGNYVPGEVGLEQVSGIEELAQRVLMRLTAPRGSFALLPNYGSRLSMLPGIRPSHRESAALQFVAEALEEEVGLKLRSVELLAPDGEEAGRLLVQLEYQGKPLQIEAGI